MLIGIPPSAERVTFKIDELRRKEICIQNVRRQNGCAQKAVEQIASRSFDVNIMITHRFTFGQTGEAFDLVAQYGDGVLKAMILFD
jgi:threonine dehydrogenase-like Zn-dependent dehydrogenase